MSSPELKTAPGPPSSPIAIATWSFGAPAVRVAYDVMIAGASSLDAVEAGINVTELDPTVSSVGYGGRPNAVGILELDAAIMDGPGHRAGSVAALRDIRRPISVARCVMEHSPHVMLVGEGALEFALAHGFSREDTFEEASHREYQRWVAEGRPVRWLGGADPADATGAPAGHDTIGLAALDRSGRLAVGCSTSGLGFKAVGRVGDSPIIGSGLYVDQRAGAATATGVGELIMRHCLSYLVVESMRSGLSPQDACDRAILRLVETDARYAALQVGVIALGRDGRTGAASTRPPAHALTYAVADEDGTRLLEAHIPLPARDNV